MIAPSVVHDGVPASLLTGLMESEPEDAEPADERVLEEAEVVSLAVIMDIKNVVTTTVGPAAGEEHSLHVTAVAVGAYAALKFPVEREEDAYVVELTVVVLYSVTIVLLAAAAAEAALILECIVMLAMQAVQMAHACCMAQQT